MNLEPETIFLVACAVWELAGNNAARRPKGTTISWAFVAMAAVGAGRDLFGTEGPVDGLLLVVFFGCALFFFYDARRNGVRLCRRESVQAAQQAAAADGAALRR
jgi:hypothetical protein